jgi:hypothetical protein
MACAAFTSSAHYPITTTNGLASIPNLESLVTRASRRLSRRTFIPGLLPLLAFNVPAWAEKKGGGDAGTKTPISVGYRAILLDVGGEKVPCAQWYPLMMSGDDTRVRDHMDQPYKYVIGIANLFKAFLNVNLPIPNPTMQFGDAAVRYGGVAATSIKGCIIFAHGVLGSRFDMATLCEALAREGFVVSAADFAESISASFTPNQATTRNAIIEAQMLLSRRDFGASEFGIFGHSAGGGSATMMQGNFVLGRCAIAGARPYDGRDPLYVVASIGDGVVPLERVRMAVPSDLKVESDLTKIDWGRHRSQALLIQQALPGATHPPNHISFLDDDVSKAMIRVLSPLLPLAKILKLPVLDFDIYKVRQDAKQTAAALRPTILQFFVHNYNNKGP